MTAARERASGRSAGRGLVLTILAVAAGFFLLAYGFDGSGVSTGAEGSGSSAGAGEQSGDDSDGGAEETGDGAADGAADGDGASADVTTTTTAPPPPPLVTRRPGEVKAATVNGTSRAGLAGAAADLLSARGYVASAKNAARPPVQVSAIYYMSGYGDDAKAVAAALNAPANVLAPAPANVLTLVANSASVSDFHIFVVLGTDETIPVLVS